MGGDLGEALNAGLDDGLTLDQWHQRYQQQARWTADVRNYLIEKASLHPGGRVLEVGVGTGAVLNAITEERSIHPLGVDLNRLSLNYARGINSAFCLIQADGVRLPFPAGKFDLAYCHYLLLWAADPSQILQEMGRVTQPGGAIIALAEPDHESRIDYPPPLDHLGKLQTKALAEQGADTSIGRRLRGLFEQTGLTDVEAGLLGARWTKAPSHTEALEWMTIQSDLENWMSKDQLTKYQEADQAAYQSGDRVLFIPTFYAMGRAH